MEYQDLVNIISESSKDINHLIEKMSLGTIIIAKNAISKSDVKKIKNNTTNFFRSTPSTFFKVQEGVKNFHRIIDNQNNKSYGVGTSRHSAYTFPWNFDETGCRNEIMKVWSNVKKFSGLNPDSYEKNTPVNGVVDRIQVALYPRKHGFLNCHVDPFHNQLTFVSIYLSKKRRWILQ